MNFKIDKWFIGLLLFGVILSLTDASKNRKRRDSRADYEVMEADDANEQSSSATESASGTTEVGETVVLDDEPPISKSKARRLKRRQKARKIAITDDNDTSSDDEDTSVPQVSTDDSDDVSKTDEDSTDGNDDVRKIDKTTNENDDSDDEGDSDKEATVNDEGDDEDKDEIESGATASDDSDDEEKPEDEEGRTEVTSFKNRRSKRATAKKLSNSVNDAALASDTAEETEATDEATEESTEESPKKFSEEDQSQPPANNVGHQESEAELEADIAEEPKDVSVVQQLSKKGKEESEETVSDTEVDVQSPPEVDETVVTKSEPINPANRKPFTKFTGEIQPISTLDPIAKFEQLTCRATSLDVNSIGVSKESMESMLSEIVQNIIRRSLGNEHQAGIVISINAQPADTDASFSDNDLDNIRTLLLFREQNPTMSYLERSFQNKGNTFITETILKVAEHIKNSLKVNSNSISKNNIEEIQSFQTAAELLWKDQPDSNQSELANKFGDPDSVVDTNVDSCNLLELIQALKQIFSLKNASVCRQGKRECNASILATLLVNVNLASDFKNAVCLSIYGNVDHCQYLSGEVKALYDLLWPSIQGYVAYKTKICNRKKCDVDGDDMALYIAYLQEQFLKTRDGNYALKDKNEVDEWKKVKRRLQILKYVSTTASYTSDINELLTHISTLIE